VFSVPFLLGLQFRNHWRYICCSLARWFLLVHWFPSCWFCLFGWGFFFRAPWVQFGLFVLSCWFGLCWFLFFDSTLQGWGVAAVVGAFFFLFSFGLLLFCLGRFTMFFPCIHQWICNCFIFHVCRSQDLVLFEFFLVLQSYHERK